MLCPTQKISKFQLFSVLFYISWYIQYCQGFRLKTINEIITLICSYNENLDLYKSRVANCISEWKSRLFDIPAHPDDAGDPHYITFSPFEAKLHEPILKKIIEQQEDKVSVPKFFAS